MFQSRAALRQSSALAAPSRRPFSTTTAVSALSPYRSSGLPSRSPGSSKGPSQSSSSPSQPSSSSPSSTASPSSASKRNHGTAATAAAPVIPPKQSIANKVPTGPRPSPSPAFNREDRWSGLSPLKPTRQPEMDHSFVGMTGGEIFHEMMLRHGVKHVFGYPGGAILPVFDAIYNSPHFDFILPRHEQGAGHMAEGYARACGKPGVVIVTSGPGATNVVTAMQDALMDGTPMVVFCGQVPTAAIGSDAFQEADIVGISRPCTKWNVMVKNIAELPTRINEAFEIATSGRPGPVLVDLPKDITGGTLTRPIPLVSNLPTHPSAATLAAREISRLKLNASIENAAKLINMAKKPVIYAGQGILSSPDGPLRLKELADKASIPVTTTLHALGAFDELDPKALHMLGMHGSCYANSAMQEADLILALGGRFDDRITGNVNKFAPVAKLAAEQGRGGIIHFEIMPKNINKVVQATEAVEGDVVANLAALMPHVNPVSMEERSEWFGKINGWKEKYPWAYEKEAPGGPLKPQTVVATLSDVTADIKDKVTIVTGVGQHQMWTAQHFRWRTPRSMICSGGLGTMGYGLPAAIGAKVAAPEKTVIDIDGDGSFCMTLTELSTAVEFGIGAKVLILNNEEQGMVIQWQSLFYKDRFAHSRQRNPNFVKLAKAMGCPARKTTKLDTLEADLRWLLEDGLHEGDEQGVEGMEVSGVGGLAYKGPKVLEVLVDQNVPVLPMVPGGSALDEFLAYDPVKESARRKLSLDRNCG